MPDTPATEVVMKLQVAQHDELHLRSLSATEELGRLFEFNVLALSDPGAEVDAAALLGLTAGISIETADGSRRWMHGVIAQAGLDGAQGGMLAWRLQLRPWLWKLTRRSDCRIFQNMTVEDIIKKVFENHPGDVVFELQGSYTPRLYCVQYRETDFNFVSRLMEEEGIYYFHRHEEDKHTLVICDKMTSHADFPGYDSLKFRETQDQLIDLGSVSQWRHVNELTPGKVTLTDYDYHKPSTSLLVDNTSTQGESRTQFERYDHPGLYTETARGRNLAQVRMQEFDTRVLRISGFTSTLTGLCTGYRFALTEHPLAAENTDHVIVSTHIELQYAGYESGGGETRFTCRFGAMRYAHIFRPERITPKPVIPGPQTAVVVGPSGEEIHTDSMGRVKVHFHWDRIGQSNENDSCWVRVASGWAGKAWGMISLPRIGQEVVVDFIEGDPDQPLITSRVYNAEQVVPYALPDNKTVSTIKSQSSKGGTTANANELRFEDKKGEEYVWFQAEKDHNHLVKNNSKTHIRANEDRTVGGKLTSMVQGDHHHHVKGQFRHMVDGDSQSYVMSDACMNVDGFYQLWTGDASFECERTSWCNTEWHHVVSGAMNTKAGSVSLKADTIAIEAGSKISLKVGGNFVVIDSSGVSINGSVVNINSGGSADAPTAPTEIEMQQADEPDDAAVPEDPLTPNA